PLLVALPWLWGGTSAVRGFLALLAGIFPFLVEPILFEALGDRILSVALALALALGLPFATGAGQIFPDLPTGLLVLALAASLVRPASRPGLAAAVGLAVLPWLHFKNLAPAAVLALPFGARLWRERATGQAARLAAVPLASAATVCGFNVWAFGSLRGPYGSGALAWNPGKWAPILAGLHFDQAQGLFVQQPLWLLGLLGLVVWIRRDPVRAAWVGALYLSLILPNAMHENMYGGWSFAGRFFWSAVPLWVFPLAAGARLVQDRSHAALAAAIGLGGLVDVHHLALCLPAPGYLRQVGPHAPLWAYRGLWPSIAAELPRFGGAGGWPVPDFCALGAALAIVALGVALSHGWRRSTRASLVALACVAAVARAGRIREPAPVFSAECFASAALPIDDHGAAGQGGVVADAAAWNGRGVELRHAARFGPYLAVPPGRYRYATRLAAAGPFSVRLAVRSEALGSVASRRLAAAELPADGGYGLVGLDFALPRGASDLELVTESQGGPVREDRLGIFAAGAPATLARCPR
ncbi:MAG TPA: hypothetical protein VMB50_16750, partial [Myxococcales bacterium]|nr:hypothetical protein [Myxococcales bacterium]